MYNSFKFFKVEIFWSTESFTDAKLSTDKLSSSVQVCNKAQILSELTL